MADDDDAPLRGRPWLRRLWTFSFAFNYIVALGVNNVPKAFWDGGYILAGFALAVATGMSYVSSVWMFETLARATGLQTMSSDDSEQDALLVNDRTSEDGGAGAVAPALTLEERDASIDSKRREAVLPVRSSATAYGSTASPAKRAMQREPTRMAVGARKYEIAELVQQFLGTWPRYLYILAHVLFSFGKLWGFTSLFATTFAEITPLAVVFGATSNYVCDFGVSNRNDIPSECIQSYRVFVLACALVMAVASQLTFRQLRYGQVAMMLYRLLALVLMVVTAIVNMYTEGYRDSSSRTSAPFVADGVLPFKWSGFLIMLPTMVLAQVSHHAIPNIVHAQTAPDKDRMHQLYFRSLAATYLFYVTMGVTIPLWTGKETEEIVTSNWICFEPPCDQNSLAYDVLVRYPIILLPVVLAISSFPLEVITISDNLKLLAPSGTSLSGGKAGFGGLSVRERLLRVLLVALPMVCAVFVFDFSTAIGFTSLMGVFVAFVFPALLQYFSKRSVDRRLLDTGYLRTEELHTPYSGFYSESVWTVLVLIVSGVLFVLMFVGAVVYS